MTGFNPHDFSRPVVVAELGFEVEKGKLLQDEISRLEANGLSTDTINIQADILNIAAETAAARDVYFVARLNDAARVVLLSEFAEGADLDLKVKRSGLIRLQGEEDPALQERERIAQKGKSSGGPDHYYIDRALKVDSRVRDVRVFGETRNITERWLILSVLTHDNKGLADQDLLDRIQASCTAVDFKRSFVQVQTVSAVVSTVNVSCKLYYYPDAIIPEHPEAALLKAYIVDQRQGFDITESYLIRYLHAAGVQRVQLLGWADRFAAPNEAFALGDIDVTTERLLS